MRDIDMKVKPSVIDLNQYVSCDSVVDYNNPEIINLAEKIWKQANNGIDYVRHAYEFVRDNISHSADIHHNQVTCSASEVLEAGHGICFAKSNLLAALLRCKGIPAGFCYQKLILDDEDANYLIYHGLNGVYIEECDRWIRLDARGNKEGVDAQFSLMDEKLAFPIREELGEEDDFSIYPKPDENILKALRENETMYDLWENLPKELAKK